MFIKKNKINLTKMYFSLSGEISSDNILLIARILLPLAISKPAKYSVNHKKDCSLKNMGISLREIISEELEYFEVVDDRGEQVLVISQPFLRLHTPVPVFECYVVSANDKEFRREIAAIKEIAKICELHYGYARQLREDYLATNEKKIESGIFGGVKIRSGKIEEDWYINPGEICDGAFKRIYPVNYWPPKVLKKILSADLPLMEKIKNDGDIFVFDQASRDEWEKNHKIKAFLSFDAT